VDLPDAVKDLIATLTDTEVGTFWIDWRYRQGSHELTDLILDLRQWDKQADVATRNRDATRKAAVTALVEAGLSYREIGEIIGVSHQRVGQLQKSNQADNHYYRAGAATLDTIWTQEVVARLRSIAVHSADIGTGQEYLSPLEAALALLVDTARHVRPDTRKKLLSTTAEVLDDVASDEEFLRKPAAS
jgi:hypothetical protein